MFVNAATARQISPEEETLEQVEAEPNTSIRDHQITKDGEDLTAYLAPYKRYTPIPFEEYPELYRRYRSGGASERQRICDRIVYSHARLVLSVARRYQGRGLTLLDLMQEGMGTLAEKVVPRFDPEGGAAFATFARYALRNALDIAIKEASANLAGRVSPQRQRNILRVRRRAAKLQNKLNRVPTILEVYLDLKSDNTKSAQQLTLAQVADWLETPDLNEIDRLDAPAIEGDQESSPLIDRLNVGPPAADVVYEVKKLLKEYRATMNKVEEVIKTFLDAREERVLDMSVGRTTVEAMSGVETAQRIVVSRQRIEQIGDRGFAVIKEKLGMDEARVRHVFYTVEELEAIIDAI